MKKQVLIGVLLIVALIFSCKKKGTDESARPSTYVDFVVDVGNPSYANLNAIGGWVYIYGQGVKGIILYRVNISEINAYERNCTYQPSSSCAPIIVDVSGFTMTDTCSGCKSKFLTSDGSVNTGPATLPLTRYQTTFDGQQVHVFN